MDGDNIAVFDQTAEGRFLKIAVLIFPRCRGVTNVSTESFRYICHTATDFTQSDNSPHFSVKLAERRSDMGEYRLLLPLTAFDILVIITAVSHQVKQHRKGMLNDRIGRISCHIFNGNSATQCRIMVDIVHPRRRDTDKL